MIAAEKLSSDCMHGASNCLLGLGASIGRHLVGRDRECALERMQMALAHLQQLAHTTLVAVSPVYLSRAWGQRRPGHYLNAAVVLETTLPPLTLLNRVLAIEQHCGRRRHRRRWRKRALDIDMLLYARETISAAQLVIPHRWLWRREFALLPAADLAGYLGNPWPSLIARRLRRIRGYPLARPVRILEQIPIP